jgi:hypothetical protein
MMRHFAWLVAFLMAGPFVSARADDRELFGKKEGGVGLIGILYDLKQTQKQQPTGVRPPDYSRIIDEFLAKDWSEAVLNRYFRATRALHTTQIFIPLMNAGLAPKAFDVDKVIKPAAWVIYYKGQVSPPADGNYRFIGYADDLLAVAVNGKTVCVGARFDVRSWKAREKAPPVAAANGRLTFGDWTSMKKDEPIDLDILVGERPGGQFCAFLLYEKQGETYPKDAHGRTMYPLFQLSPHATPRGAPGEAPAFSLESPVWTAHQ